MNDVIENADELGGVTEGVAGAKSKKKPMNPRLKKVLSGTIIAAAVGVAIYGLVSDQEPVLPVPSSAEAGTANAESVANDDEPIEENQLTVTPVLSIFGKTVEGPKEALDEPATITAEPEDVKPIVGESAPSVPPVAAASPSTELEKLVTALDKQDSHQKADSAATPGESPTYPEQEALARTEAQTAAFDNPINAANSTAARVDKPGIASALHNQDPVLTGERRAVGPQNQVYNSFPTGAHGALSGSNNLRVSKPEAVVGLVSKLKHASDQVYFVKVAKMLPTKILLLPEPKAKVISFISNPQEWEVKQFSDGVLIVELKPNAASSSVSDLLIQQGGRYYSFTLASSSVIAERNNMVIFTK